jgi:hypothetical protein
VEEPDAIGYELALEDDPLPPIGCSIGFERPGDTPTEPRIAVLPVGGELGPLPAAPRFMEFAKSWGRLDPDEDVGAVPAEGRR